jgi:hypothetical protein
MTEVDFPKINKSPSLMARVQQPPDKALQLTRLSVLQSGLVAFGCGRSATCTLPVSRLAAERQIR